jgi:hypothetical protein
MLLSVLGHLLVSKFANKGKMKGEQSIIETFQMLICVNIVKLEEP